ncbi:AsmA family protein [Vibrio sp. Isolate25]|uniref:AsmA family protein n=1 Tax=Vibrio sp. Isolate25 TaxID=2908535 RepID=UPI001EFE1F73|nr:AsmA family protein [Vibrio sp. Isolate25]MCG9597733.1 AsmA family protein [Vibrio sp. Isolate25]
MKKALLLTAIAIVSLISLPLLALFVLLNTSYASQVVNGMLQNLTPYTITTQRASYTPPYQLTLEDVEIGAESNALHIPKLTLWLSPSLWKNNKASLDSVLIEGATVDLTDFNSPLLQSVNLEQLALQHVDITAPGWSARDVNLQVTQPQWSSAQQYLPYGDVQLSAQQLYIKGEALDNLLIDAQYQAQDSTIYGASFQWHGADISGQAEQFSQGWSLINVTVNKLEMPSSTSAEKLLSRLKSLNLPVYHINSLDLLSSNIHYAGWQFNQLDASLENLYLDRPLWLQENGYISFDAESADFEQIRLISPTARLGLSANQIAVDEFDADFKQGRIQFNGKITPNKVALNQLKVSGVKWLEQTDQLLRTLSDVSKPLHSLSIADLDIENAQLIQVERSPYWQVSGLNIEGENLTLIHQNQVGLHNGHLEVSVNNASIEQLMTTQAVLTATAQQGDITLQRAFVPLDQGYIEASGQWQRQSASAPWQLSLHTDGFQVNQPLLQAQLPFKLAGLAEVELELSGLSGDYAMLAHSLTGSINAYLHDGALEAKTVDGATNHLQLWPLDKVAVDVDRGRIKVSSDGESAELAGQIDLTKPQFGTLIFTSKHHCQRLWSDIFTRTNIIEDVCGEQVESTLPASEENHSSEDEDAGKSNINL